MACVASSPTLPLLVRNVAHCPITTADVRPGDIGFEYKRRGKSWDQSLIAFGAHVQNRARRAFRGDSGVLHTFIVTDVRPAANQLTIADAAAGGNQDGRVPKRQGLGVREQSMSFNSNAPYTDLRADTLFCRFKDPAMSSALVRFAKAWCVPGATNFSKLHAGFAPWHRKHLHERSRARLLGVTADLTRGRPVTDPDGKPSRVMCSEFVADVGAAAAMALHCRDQGLPEDSPVGLQGLRQGHGGSVFDGDPRGTVPMALHARMVADPAVSVVGYIPAPLGAKGF